MTFKTSQRPPSRRGMYLIAGILAFGGLILLGLFLAPIPNSPPVPEGSRPGVPGRTLRFVACAPRLQRVGADALAEQVRRLNPDYVLLASVAEEDVVPIAKVLGMQSSYHPRLYERAENQAGRHAEWGVCILARESLYAGAPIVGPRGNCGASAVSVVDGCRIGIGCLAYSARAGEEASAWRVGRPADLPVAAAELWPAGVAPVAAEGEQIVGNGPLVLRFAPAWRVIGHDAVPVGGSDLVWADVTAASLPPAISR